MTAWKNPHVVLKVPKKLAEDIKSLAIKQYPPITWSDQARAILYTYVAMHRARGNVE